MLWVRAGEYNKEMKDIVRNITHALIIPLTSGKLSLDLSNIVRIAIRITKAFRTPPIPKLPNLIELNTTSSEERVMITRKKKKYLSNVKTKPITIANGKLSKYKYCSPTS